MAVPNLPGYTDRIQYNFNGNNNEALTNHQTELQVFGWQTSITTLTSDGLGTATATTSGNHDLAVGDKVKISGAIEADFNTYKDPDIKSDHIRVSAIVSDTQFKYPVIGTPSTPATGTIVVNSPFYLDFTQVLADGADLKMSYSDDDATQTEVDFFKPVWDDNNLIGILWPEITSIAINEDLKVFLYYNKSGQADSSSYSDAMKSSRGVRAAIDHAVFNLDDTGGTTIDDATTNAYDLTLSNRLALATYPMPSGSPLLSGTSALGCNGVNWASNATLLDSVVSTDDGVIKFSFVPNQTLTTGTGDHTIFTKLNNLTGSAEEYLYCYITDFDGTLAVVKADGGSVISVASVDTSWTKGRRYDIEIHYGASSPQAKFALIVDDQTPVTNANTTAWGIKHATGSDFTLGCYPTSTASPPATVTNNSELEVVGFWVENWTSGSAVDLSKYTFLPHTVRGKQLLDATGTYPLTASDYYVTSDVHNIYNNGKRDKTYYLISQDNPAATQDDTRYTTFSSLMDTPPAAFQIRAKFSPTLTISAGYGVNARLLSKFTNVRDGGGGGDFSEFDVLDCYFVQATGILRCDLAEYDGTTTTRVRIDSTTTTWTAGAIYDVIIEFGSHGARLVVNGVIEASDADTQQLNPSGFDGRTDGQAFSLGTYNYGTAKVQSFVGDWLYFHAADITTTFSFLARHDFADQTGTTATDLEGTYDGTLTNSAMWGGSQEINEVESFNSGSHLDFDNQYYATSNEVLDGYFRNFELAQTISPNVDFPTGAFATDYIFHQALWEEKVPYTNALYHATAATVLDVFPERLLGIFAFKCDATFSSASSTDEYLMQKVHTETGGSEVRFDLYLSATDGKLHMDITNAGTTQTDVVTTEASWTGGTWYLIEFETGDRKHCIRVNDEASNAATVVQATSIIPTTSGTVRDFIYGASNVGGGSATKSFDGKLSPLVLIDLDDPTNLIADWAFTEGAGTSVADRSGNSHTMTMRNAAGTPTAMWDAGDTNLCDISLSLLSTGIMRFTHKFFGQTTTIDSTRKYWGAGQSYYVRASLGISGMVLRVDEQWDAESVLTRHGIYGAQSELFTYGAYNTKVAAPANFFDGKMSQISQSEELTSNLRGLSVFESRNDVADSFVRQGIAVDNRVALAGWGATSQKMFEEMYPRYKLNATSISAGSFVVDVSYKIVTVGTTDFTLIGASGNTVGVTFVATGVGSGTGTASDSDILLVGKATPIPKPTTDWSTVDLACFKSADGINFTDIGTSLNPVLPSQGRPGQLRDADGHPATETEVSAAWQASTVYKTIAGVQPTSSNSYFYRNITEANARKYITTITFTTTTAEVYCKAHGYSNGDIININSVAGTTADADKYNGDFTIASVTTDYFEYTMSGTPSANAIGSTMYARKLLESGASEPTWPTGLAATVVDGDITWERLTGEIDIDYYRIYTASYSRLDDPFMSRFSCEDFDDAHYREGEVFNRRPSFTIISASASAGVATFTTNTPHGLLTDDRASIKGTANYDKDPNEIPPQVTVSSATVFTIALGSTPATETFKASRAASTPYSAADKIAPLAGNQGSSVHFADGPEYVIQVDTGGGGSTSSSTEEPDWVALMPTIGVSTWTDGTVTWIRVAPATTDTAAAEHVGGGYVENPVVCLDSDGSKYMLTGELYGGFWADPKMVSSDEFFFDTVTTGAPELLSILPHSINYSTADDPQIIIDDGKYAAFWHGNISTTGTLPSDIGYSFSYDNETWFNDRSLYNIFIRSDYYHRDQVADIALLEVPNVAGGTDVMVYVLEYTDQLVAHISVYKATNKTIATIFNPRPTITAGVAQIFVPMSSFTPAMYIAVRSRAN